MYYCRLEKQALFTAQCVCVTAVYAGKKNQWDEIVLRPEETVHTFSWFMEMGQNEEGEEEWMIRRGVRSEEVMMKLEWGVK